MTKKRNGANLRSSGQPSTKWLPVKVRPAALCGSTFNGSYILLRRRREVQIVLLFIQFHLLPKLPFQPSCILLLSLCVGKRRPPASPPRPPQAARRRRCVPRSSWYPCWACSTSSCPSVLSKAPPGRPSTRSLQPSSSLARSDSIPSHDSCNVFCSHFPLLKINSPATL